MATIIIENVPDTFVKKYFKTAFSYDEVRIIPKKIEKDPTIRLQKMIENPENTSY
jgi:tyrosyl-tRNA synthetase